MDKGVEKKLVFLLAKNEDQSQRIPLLYMTILEGRPNPNLDFTTRPSSLKWSI